MTRKRINPTNANGRAAPKIGTPSSLSKKEAQPSVKIIDYFNKFLNVLCGSTESFTSGAENDPAYTPLNSIAFKLFLICRFCSAMMSNINDCDETFNYWEPLHFLLYNRGFQTWEYSPEFALRSYSFVWLYGWPLYLLKFFVESRLLLFFMMRLGMAVCCACCEVIFYRSIVKIYGNSVSRLVLIFLAFSPGMFAASVAFLPSSFCMYLCFIAFASVFLFQNILSISAVALSVLIGWPFSAIIGIPVAIDILFFQKRIKLFATTSVTCLIVIMSYMCFIDFHYYQKFVVATWNIVKYNIFTSHGPNLYGTEPVSFYLKNGFLNMSIAFPLSFLTPLMLLLLFFTKVKSFIILYPRKWLPLIALFVWYGVFFTQPHKEERFLYPVYPLIALSAALSVKLLSQFALSSLPLSFRNWSSLLTALVMVVQIVLGLSRIGSQFVGYHAPIDAYGEFSAWYDQNNDRPKHVEEILCVGREWHKFPSSFFLPNNFRLEFIKSQFDGQLPAHYLEDSSFPSADTRNSFNDLNKEDISRYVDISKCDFLVDTFIASESSLEPLYASDFKRWKPIVAREIIIPHLSHHICRAYYIPFLSHWCTRYSTYVILQSIT